MHNEASMPGMSVEVDNILKIVGPGRNLSAMDVYHEILLV